MTHDYHVINILSGGSIGTASLIMYEGKKAVLKSYPKNPHLIIQAEEKGLNELLKQEIIRSPKVFANAGDHLIIEYLPPRHGPVNDSDFFQFGVQLATMHRDVTEEKFGLSFENFIGSTPQFNKQNDQWCDFYFEQRIVPQLRMTKMTHHKDLLQEVCWTLLKGIEVRPSLVHGDLWRGNIYWTPEGPAFFDPAVYYGHGEVDLAMTKLFGELPPVFYQGYDSILPDPDGQRDKREILYNLYHLLNHIILFGDSYRSQVEDNVSRLANFLVNK